MPYWQSLPIVQLYKNVLIPCENHFDFGIAFLDFSSQFQNGARVALRFGALDEATHFHPLPVLPAGDGLVESDRPRRRWTERSQVGQPAQRNGRHKASVVGFSFDQQVFAELRRFRPGAIESHANARSHALEKKEIPAGQ